jgi:hypothetical protein
LDGSYETRFELVTPEGVGVTLVSQTTKDKVSGKWVSTFKHTYADGTVAEGKQMYFSDGTSVAKYSVNYWWGLQLEVMTTYEADGTSRQEYSGIERNGRTRLTVNTNVTHKTGDIVSEWDTHTVWEDGTTDDVHGTLNKKSEIHWVGRTREWNGNVSDWTLTRGKDGVHRYESIVNTRDGQVIRQTGSMRWDKVNKHWVGNSRSIYGDGTVMTSEWKQIDEGLISGQGQVKYWNGDVSNYTFGTRLDGSIYETGF